MGGADSRSAIVAAAVEILDAEGLEAVTLRRLAEATHFGKSTIEYHWQNQATFTALLHREMSLEFVQILERWAMFDPSTWMDYADAMVEWHLTRPHRASLVFDLDRPIIEERYAFTAGLFGSRADEYLVHQTINAMGRLQQQLLPLVEPDRRSQFVIATTGLVYDIGRVCTDVQTTFETANEQAAHLATSRIEVWFRELGLSPGPHAKDLPEP